MNNRLQFKLAGSKAQFGNNKTIQNLKELIHSDQNFEQLREIKLSYCERFTSLEGIQRLKQVRQLYISSNNITSLLELRGIANLQVLQAKHNKISSLEGLQHFTRLQKIIAPYNIITNLEPLSSFHSHNSLTVIILFANQIQSSDQIQHLRPFTKLTQIVFETQTDYNKQTTKHPLLKDIKNIQLQMNKGNPACKNKLQYHNALRESLVQSTATLQKIDDMTGRILVKFMIQGHFSTHNQNNSQSMTNTGNVQIVRQRTQYKKQSHEKNNQKQFYTLRNQEMMQMTERQADLQRILDIKEDTICQLKSKLNTLQMTHAVQFKDSLKKQAEYERSLGQLSELAKQIEFKDSQINQLHRRIENLFKTNANNNILADTKSQQLQKTRNQLVQLKIQNARLITLNTHFQSSTRDLQQKALFNFQEKSRRMQQLRYRNQQLIKDQCDMQKQLGEYKDRVRQLTQLLKEWQLKFQKKIGELETYHNNQRGQLINEISKREEENRRVWQQQMRKQSVQSDQKIKVLEQQYSKVLDETLHKYKQLKDMYDHKSHSQAEVKSFLKSVLSKNAQYENHLKEFEEIIIASRNNITKITQENDYLIKQCQQVRGRWAHQSQTLKAELSKYQFSCEKMQAEIKDLKINNDYLQKNFDHFSLRQKQMQEMIEKIQNLQTALDAKNIMLDDKNETIDSLKQQIEGLQKDQQHQVDAKQFDKISKKYSRQKQILKNLQEQISKLTEQNKELSDKMQVFNSMEEEFIGIRQIIAKQEIEIKQKSEAVDQLSEYLQKLKKIVQNLTQQNKNLRLQNNKQFQSFQNKEQKMIKIAKEKDNEYQHKLITANQQIAKYKGFAEQLQNFTKNLNL